MKFWTRFKRLFKKTTRPLDDVLKTIESLDRDIFAMYYLAKFGVEKIPVMHGSIETYIELMVKFTTRDRAHLEVSSYQYNTEIQLVTLQRFLQTTDGMMLDLRNICDKFKIAASEFLVQWNAAEHSVQERNQMLTGRFLLSVQTLINLFSDLQEEINPGKNTKH